MTKAAEESVREWRRRINRGEYFEAHEAAEEAWMSAAEPDKTFLKGLIHGAVALEHYRRGNAHGARVKYGSCVQYLSPYAPEYAGVPVARFLRDMERFFAPLLLQERGFPPPPPPVPWPTIGESDE